MEPISQIAEVTLSYTPKISPSKRPVVHSSEEAVKLFRSVWSNKICYIEEMMMLLLNRSNRVLGFIKIGAGGTTGTVVDVKIIYQGALKANASGIILCHNHPSGNVQPSDADIKLTRQVKEAGRLLDIALLDHLILTDTGFYSLADEGLL